jgi:hypothetical protein
MYHVLVHPLYCFFLPISCFLKMTSTPVIHIHTCIEKYIDHFHPTLSSLFILYISSPYHHYCHLNMSHLMFPSSLLKLLFIVQCKYIVLCGLLGNFYIQDSFLCNFISSFPIWMAYICLLCADLKFQCCVD